MRHRWEIWGASIAVATLALLIVASTGSSAQSPAPAPAQAPAQAPDKAPAKPSAQPPAAAAPATPSPPSATAPYKAVALTLPVPSKDASFEAFRKQLGEIAKRRDRAALGKLIVGKGFFWERPEGDKAEAKKSGIANLAAAMGLDQKEDPDTGWDTIAIYAADPTVFPLPEHKDVTCGPADPDFDDGAFQALVDETQTDISDWVYPLAAGLELHDKPSAGAAVNEKAGLVFLRVLPSDAPETNDPAAAEYIRVVSPSGKLGFVKVDNIASLGVGQLCYIKEGDGWKIAGVIGGVEQ